MPTLKRWSSYLFTFKHWKWTSLNIYTCKSGGAFQFSCSLVASQQRNHRKSFYHHGKYFAKENFCAPAWALAKYSGRKTVNREQARWSDSACMGSQSQHGICFVRIVRIVSVLVKQGPVICGHDLWLLRASNWFRLKVDLGWDKLTWFGNNNNNNNYYYLFIYIAWISDAQTCFTLITKKIIQYGRK